MLIRVYPEIGEAVVYRRSAPQARGRGGSGEVDGQRLLQRCREAAGRAFSRGRRYALRNRLAVRATLTIPDGVDRFDYLAVKRSVALLIRRLRRRSGAGFPWLYVLEPHPRRGGLHANLLLPGDAPRQEELAGLWASVLGVPVAHVRLNRDGARSGLRSQAAASVAYSSKDAFSFYARDLDPAAARLWRGVEVPARSHFFESAPGFAPVVEELSASSFEDALGAVGERLQGSVRVVSSTVERGGSFVPFMALRG